MSQFQTGSLILSFDLQHAGLKSIAESASKKILFDGTLGSLEYQTYSEANFSQFMRGYNYLWLLYPVSWAMALTSSPRCYLQHCEIYYSNHYLI